MNKRILAWWPKKPHPGNMGDIITPRIVKKLFGYDLEWFNKIYRTTEDILYGTGSIIGETVDNSVVWGSGLISEFSASKANVNANYIAVRGPITRELLQAKGISVPEVFGDPGLLVKEIIKEKENKKYDYGIIPHYVDYKEVKHHFKKDPNIKIIDVLNSNPLVPIKEIMQCKKTVTSSLHGIIFSHAFNVPSSWVKFSNKLAGDDTKFFDYFLSIDVEKPACTEISNSDMNINNINKLNYINIENNFDLSPLKKAFLKRFNGDN